DNNLNAFLARYPGMHILALAMLDEDANLARLRAAGLDIPGVAYLERPVEAGGPIARFARLPFPDPPEGRVQLIRHLTPELVWQDRWMDHANKAEVLEAAILCAENPAETAARLSRLAGLPLEPDAAGGFLLRLPGAARASGPKAPALETRVRVLTPEALGSVLPGVVPPASPCMAGMVVRTADGAASARRILAGIPTREAPEGIMVPPEHAAGAALIFA
ncbi:MAG: VOC family protein, partial [Roseomonas sp.]|nr:VOC family protein [Roseomonas sp.]